MEATGKLHSVNRDWKSGKIIISFELNEEPTEAINDLASCEKLRISAEEYREKRSLNANRMLWACIGDIANALHTDKWNVYLDMIKRVGKYTYICVKPSAVEAMKAQWRECEEIGPININGKEAIQMLCYFGSSTYNTKEFSRLLDEVISEMKQMGLPIPPSEDMRIALEKWGKQHEKHNTN